MTFFSLFGLVPKAELWLLFAKQQILTIATSSKSCTNAFKHFISQEDDIFIFASLELH